MNQIIHAAVRRDVARTGQALRRLDDGDADRARQIQTAWRNLVRELTHHHEAEDELLWPFLQARGVELSLLEEMEAEHVAMKSALASVSASLEALVAEPTAANATAAVDEVDRAELVINGPASFVDAANAVAWMDDGAGARERTALRSHIPGPVVAVLTKLVARRYNREVAPVWR